MGEEQRKDEDNNDWRELLKKVKKKGEESGRNPFKGGKFRFSMWYLLLAIMLISILNMFMFRGNDQSIPYSDFKVLIADGAIKEVHYSGTSLIGYSSIQQNSAESNAVPALLQDVFGSEGSSLISWKTERIDDDPTLLPLMDEMGIEVHLCGDVDL